MAYRTSTLRTRTPRALAAVVAGALVLAACGNGGESRTRNAALDPNDTCWTTEAAKNDALAVLDTDIERVLKAALEADQAMTAYELAAANSQFALEEWTKIRSVVSSEEEQREYEAKYLSAETEASTALEKWKGLQRQADGLESLRERLETESAKPLCSDVPTNDVTSSVATETSAPDVTVSASDEDTPPLSIPDAPDNTTDATETSTATVSVASVRDCGEPDVDLQASESDQRLFKLSFKKCGDFLGLIKAPETVSVTPIFDDDSWVWYLAASESGTFDIRVRHHNNNGIVESGATRIVTITVPDDVSAQPASPPTTTSLDVQRVDFPCLPPLPAEGVMQRVAVGEAAIFTVEPCGPDYRSSIGQWDLDIPVEYRAIDNAGRHQWVVTGARPGTFYFELVAISRSDSERASTATPLWLTVYDPADDPCTGTAPTATWDPDIDGGTFTASSTCDDARVISVSVKRIVAEGIQEGVFGGYLAPGYAYTNLIQMFGSGRYKVTLTQALGLDGDFALVGDEYNVDVEYTAPAPTTDPAPNATVTNGAVSNTRTAQGVTALPVFALNPVAADDDIDPQAVTPSTPVVALPATTTLVTCDETCLAGARDRAGVSEGTVEISINDGEWQTVTAQSSVVLPAAAAAVRVRVTPPSGTPVVLAAVMTRETVDEIERATPQTELVTLTLPDISASVNSGVPVWVVTVIAVLVLAAGGVLARRRLLVRTTGN